MNTVFESIDHGRPFPARIFVTQINKCDFHWHYDYELFLILKGTVNIYSGVTSTLFSEGDFFLFNSCSVHGVQRTGDDNLCLCIQFAPQTFSEDLGNQFRHCFYLNSTSDIYPPKKDFSFFRKKMAEIALSSLDQTQTSSLRTYSLLLSLIADLIDFVQYDVRRIPLGSDQGSANELYVEIFKYIEENLDSENQIKNLCRHIGMSEKSLYRYLKATLGMTAKEFLDIVKVEKACSMLREGDKPLSIIWQTCGFTSEVSFYRNFKKQKGYTPNEYRKGCTPMAGEAGGGDYLDFDLSEAIRLLLRVVEK